MVGTFLTLNGGDLQVVFFQRSQGNGVKPESLRAQCVRVCACVCVCVCVRANFSSSLCLGNSGIGTFSLYYI